MSKIAFIFPGQGAQKCGMGKDFYENSNIAEKMFELASQRLQMDMKSLCFEENEQLNLTEYTQAAMVTTCLAMARVIEERGLKPDVTAGLSLGEYCAIAMAGGMDDLDAVELVRNRGIYMQEAVVPGEGAMSAVFGLTRGHIQQIIDPIDHVFIANDNCPGQVVITGKAANVEQANTWLMEQGARRTMMLNVSGPFHSPYMEEAGKKLEVLLDQIRWNPLQIPYVTNVTGKYVTDIGETKELLTRQVSSSVEWKKSMEAMIADGVDTFVEIGPGKTLTGFLRKTDKSVKTYNVQTWKDMEKLDELIESRK